jgi:hypothetical protein
MPPPGVRTTRPALPFGKRVRYTGAGAWSARNSPLFPMGFFSNWLRGDVYTDKRSGIRFPKKIGEFTRVEEKTYEIEPGKPGVAVAYGFQDTAVTVYVRASPADVADWTSTHFLHETISGVKELEEHGVFSDLKFFELGADKEKPGWKTAAFTGTTNGAFLASFISCKAERDYMVKIRASASELTDHKLQTFITSLQDIADRAPHMV